MKYLWDTDQVICFLKGNILEGNPLWEILKNGDNAISIITYAELEVGARLVNNYHDEKQKIGRFLDLVATRLNLDFEIMDLYAESRVALEKKGTRIDDFDLLIASTAVRSKRVLVTNNRKHYNRFPGLKIYG